MAEQKIEFRKIRDFGENISDTFLFIKNNIRGLLLSILAICAVLMLAVAIFNGIYQSRFFNVFDQLRKGLYDAQYNSFNSIFTPEYFLTILFTWLSYVALQVTLASYIKVYVFQEGVAPRVEQVWDVFKRNFLRVFLFSIPVTLLTLAGFIFCIAPGIFLSVVFVPFGMILVIEDADFGYAFNRCFEIIKDNFWISLGTYIVAGMIYYFSGAIVGVVVGLVVGVFTFLTTDSVGTTAGILSSILNMFSSLFYIIFFVSAALNYFNLVEKRDGTGILNRIDRIGTSSGEMNDKEKQY
jgi:hypothetical protein